MKKAKKPSVVERIEALERNLALACDNFTSTAERVNNITPSVHWGRRLKGLEERLEVLGAANGDMGMRLDKRETSPTWRTEVKQITVELQNMERRFDGMRDELKSRDGLSGRLAGLLQRVDSLDRQIDNVAVAVSRLMQPEPKPRRRWAVPWDGVWHRIAW